MPGKRGKRSAVKCRGLSLPVFLMRCGCFVLPLVAAAQNYPVKPVRLVVPFAPGGGFEVGLRPLAQELSQRLEQPVVVDNRGGAGGIVGAEIVARAVPDGYTILGGSVSLASLPGLYKKLPFDPIRDFAPITVAVTSAYFLLVHPSAQMTSLKELIALSKQSPGQLRMGSAGNGSTIHLAGEMLKSMAGIDIVQITYKGSGPAMTALVGNEVQLMFAPTGTSLPLVTAGKLRAIAVTSVKRWSVTPQIPTLAEGGLPGYEVSGWYGLLAPAGTPRSVVDKLYAETKKALEADWIRSRLSASSLEPLGLSPEESARFIKADTARWSRVIRDAGIVKE
jgi:tripartite-type tricarboxylate transporter receptor subunit TctC